MGLAPRTNALVPVKASPAPLVWANGRPFVREALTAEIAAPMMSGVRSIYANHPSKGLTPQRIASILLEAEQGSPVRYLELAEDMEEKDLHYLSVLGTRKRQVAQLPIEVEPADDSAEAKADAKIVEDWLERDTLSSEIEDIQDAIGKGYSVIEMMWAVSDGLLLPERLEWRDPRWFEFDRVDGRTLMLRGDAGPEPLPAAKFITHTAQAKSGLPIRGGLARAAAWGWLFKNLALKDWASFLEMFGLPMRMGRYDNGTSEGDIRKLMNAVAQLGSDAAAVFPKSMEVEFIDGKSGTSPADLWQALCTYLDDQVSKAVLGQTSSSDAKAGGLGSGQSTLHNDVRGDIEAADAKLLAATLNRDLVKPMIILNRGPRARYPRLKIGRPDEVDVKALTDAATALVPLGVQVSAEAMREAAGLPAAKAGEAVLMAPAQNSPQDALEAPGGGKPPKAAPTRFLGPLKSPGEAKRNEGRATASQNERAVDPIDVATDEALDDWELLITPLLGPVEALVASSATLEQVRDGLSATIGQMDVEAVRELLARTGFGARLAGDADLGESQKG